MRLIKSVYVNFSFIIASIFHQKLLISKYFLNINAYIYMRSFYNDENNSIEKK